MDPIMFDRYCTQVVQVGAPLLAKIKSHVSMIEELTKKRPDDIFVSDFKGPNQTPAFNVLLIFTGNRVFEFENFVSDSRFSTVATPNEGLSIDMTPIEFDFKTANSLSRLAVEIKWGQGTLYGTRANATGQNCLKLAEICRNYFMP